MGGGGKSYKPAAYDPPKPPEIETYTKEEIYETGQAKEKARKAAALAGGRKSTLLTGSKLIHFEDGKMMLLRSDGSAEMWDKNTGEFIFPNRAYNGVIPPSASFNPLSFNPSEPIQYKELTFGDFVAFEFNQGGIALKNMFLSGNGSALFPNRKFVFDVGNGPFEYEFSALPIAGVLNNKRMKTDTSENLSDTRVNVPLCKDLIMLLTFGGAAVEANVHSIFFRCTPYEYLGDDVKVETFVRQNYIRVSKIISGKMASDLGNGAQQYVVKYLTRSLGNNYCVRSIFSKKRIANTQIYPTKKMSELLW